MVSQYSAKGDEVYGIKNLMLVVARKLKMQGFIVGDPRGPGHKYAEEWTKNVSKWLADGSFKAVESETDGIENAAEGFLGMLEGKNFGKAVLKIADFDVSTSSYTFHRIYGA
jgi:NADPH-dependent curcumin reductase CurA